MSGGCFTNVVTLFKIRMSCWQALGGCFTKDVFLFFRRLAGPVSPQSPAAEPRVMSVSEGCKDRLTKFCMLKKNKKK